MPLPLYTSKKIKVASFFIVFNLPAYNSTCGASLDVCLDNSYNEAHSIFQVQSRHFRLFNERGMWGHS